VPYRLPELLAADRGRTVYLVEGEKDADLEPTIRRGCREAMRVGRLGCIVKVTDQVHGLRFRDQSGWGRGELGFPYDVVHQMRPRNLEDRKWRHVLSARSNGAVYLAFRHGDQRHRARLVARGGRR
jgi:hypothetical protein